MLRGMVNERVGSHVIVASHQAKSNSCINAFAGQDNARVVESSCANGIRHLQDAVRWRAPFGHYFFFGAGFCLVGADFGAFGNSVDALMFPPVYPFLSSPAACLDWSRRARVLSASRLI